MLDVPAVRGWCHDALDALGRAREEIDALNVYPVPDGDTGTNLFLTLESATESLEARPDDGDLAAALRALTQGALLGARGNSGVILSQLARGAVAGLGGVGGADQDAAELLRGGLARAADAAYAAVAQPVEGTILTVARAAADAARATQGDAAAVVRAAAAAAHEALDRTPELLAPLREAGVVDAGGRGLVVLLDSLLATVTGERPATPPRRAAVPQPRRATAPEPGGPEYEVMYLLDAADPAVDGLRAELARLGDSLLVVGGDGLWNVHVHVDDVGAAVEAGVRAGRPYRIRVTRFADQPARAADARQGVGRAVVAMLPAGGLSELAERAGATVVAATAGRPPATRDVVEAFQRAHAGEVVVLPNARDTRAVAHAAADWARAGGLRVAVLPTRASVQVLAALAVHDPGRRFDDDVIAMTAAARATRTGTVTHAVREALTSAGVCRPGDVLGIIDEDVVVIGSEVEAVGWTVLERLLTGGGELVTVVGGVGAGVQMTALTARLRRAHPEVELAVHEGGPEAFPLLLGVE